MCDTNKDNLPINIGVIVYTKSRSPTTCKRDKYKIVGYDKDKNEVCIALVTESDDYISTKKFIEGLSISLTNETRVFVLVDNEKSSNTVVDWKIKIGAHLWISAKHFELNFELTEI